MPDRTGTRLTALTLPADVPAGVRAWHLMLDLERDFPEDLAILAANERERATRYHRAADRRRYVQTRACLRHILGATLTCNPAAVPLRANLQGKPILPGERPPVFNLSHADQHAYLALAEAPGIAAVGIDIERCLPQGPLPEWLTLACDAAEAEAIQRCEDPAARLILHWVAKEAVLKTVGTGLSESLKQVHISPGPGASFSLHTTLRQARSLQVTRLTAPPGYMAALAWQAQ